VRARLEVIAEELADMGRARLHQALEDEDSAAEASAEERRLSAARRAVLRAVSALSDADGDDGADGS